MADTDPYSARDTLSSGEVFHRIDRVADPAKLPYTVCVLLENLLRRVGDGHVTEDDVAALAAWPEERPAALPFMPARVIMQDLTGVPAVVDLAAMRAAVARRGGAAARVDPLVPVDLVIDHSVQVDAFGSDRAYQANIDREFERNGERYALLRWAQKAFQNFRVVPPGMGIVHQVNLEYLGQVVVVRDGVAMPDTLVGTDSHTTMINALGVLGWGVGGIEAEAAMLGQPLYLTHPRVLGVHVVGDLLPGVTATDLVLTITERLRAHGVVGSFVEFSGPGLSGLTVADRATISNMSPEFGSTAAIFPVDERTLGYLRETGRAEELIGLVERYTKEQGLFRSGDEPLPAYTETLDFDLSEVEPSLAGPRRPQDRVSLPGVPASFAEAFGVEHGNGTRLGDGSVAIAAITSCTNTSNPALMIAAGLLAKKAVEKGLETKPWVKTSLAPGSRVVVRLPRAGGADRATSTSCGSTWSASAARPASATAARCRRRSPARSRSATCRWRRCCRATATSRPGSIPRCGPTTWRRRRWLWPTRWPARVNGDLSSEPLGTGDDGQPVMLARRLADRRRGRAAACADALGADLYRDPVRPHLRRRRPLARPARARG